MKLQDTNRALQEGQVAFMDRDLLFWIIVPALLLLILTYLRRRRRDFHVPEVAAEDFDEVVIDSPLPVLIHFYDPSHVGDQVMIAQVERLGRRAENEFGVGFVNIGKSPELAERFAPVSPPCLKLFRDGRTISTYEGVFDEVDIYHQVLDQLNAQGRDDEAPSPQ